MVPFEESGLKFSLVLKRIKSYLLLERKIPFLFTTRGLGGTDPGPRGTRIVAQVTTDGLIDFTELKSGKSFEGTVEAEEAEPQNTHLQEVLKSHYTNYSLYQKEVGQSPVSGVLSKEKPDEGDGDKSPVSGETPDENGGEGGVHISPMDDESPETVDEDDSHGSDDSDDQTTAPTSCGSETSESDYQQRRRIIGQLYKAVVEQSKRRARKELEHMSLKIGLCDKMADLKSLVKQMSETEMNQHEQKIEDKKVTNPED
jgi:hypothetical protein